jgi:hypothetical protein
MGAKPAGVAYLWQRLFAYHPATPSAANAALRARASAGYALPDQPESSAAARASAVMTAGGSMTLPPTPAG